MAFETEIFVPSYHYDETGIEILVSDGDWRYVKERQTLYYRHSDMRPGAVHSVQIKPLKGPFAAAAGLSPRQGNIGNNNGSLTSLGNSSSLSLQKMQSAESIKSVNGRVTGRIGHEPLEPSRLKIEEVYGGREARVRAESEAGCLCAVM